MFRPTDEGRGSSFHPRLRMGLYPEGLLSVEEGVREASTVGVIMGYPLTDLRVTLLKALIDPNNPPSSPLRSLLPTR